MQYIIEGELAQIARIQLSAGDAVWGSKGSLVCIPPELRWQLRVPGGIEGAARRVLSGESIALMYLESDRNELEAVLSSNQPGKMIPWDLESDGPVITTRGSFVAAFGAEIRSSCKSSIFVPALLRGTSHRQPPN